MARAHFVIFIRDPTTGTVGADPCVRPGADTRVGPYTVALPQVMQWFKTMTTNNYMQHVIRNETTLNAIREYALNNPLKWHLDRNNPNNLR